MADWWCEIWNCILFFLKDPSASGWVQAIGAMLALAVAIWVPNRQNKNGLRERRKSMLAVAEAAHTHAFNIRAAIDSSDFQQGEINLKILNVYDKSIIVGIVRALQGIPLHELGSRSGVIALLSMTDQIVFLGNSVEAFIAGPYKHANLAKTIESYPEHYPDSFKKRQELYVSGFSILARNARQNLDKIDQDYQSLIESVST